MLYISGNTNKAAGPTLCDATISPIAERHGVNLYKAVQFPSSFLFASIVQPNSLCLSLSLSLPPTQSPYCTISPQLGLTLRSYLLVLDSTKPGSQKKPTRDIGGEIYKTGNIPEQSYHYWSGSVAVVFSKAPSVLVEFLCTCYRLLTAVGERAKEDIDCPSSGNY